MLKRLYPPLSSEVRTRIITLWAVLLVGVVAIGGVALFMGNFIRGNVREQLGAQQIVFTAAKDLTPEERASDACLIRYGGTQMLTGAQAQCYSEAYIALHMRASAEKAGFPGATYATLGKEQTKIRDEIATAQKAGNQDALKAANDKLTAATNLRTTMQTGSTLRGQLLNAWGWDTFGVGIIATGAAMFVVALVFAVALAYELTAQTATVTRPVSGKSPALAPAAQ